MFFGTDGNGYDIDIPVPFLYDSEEEAMEAEEFWLQILMVVRRTQYCYLQKRKTLW